jgi:hypothetical protein
MPHNSSLIVREGDTCAANVEPVYAILLRSKVISSKLRTRDHAARVAWRIIRHWIDAQLALVQASLVPTGQVFRIRLANYTVDRVPEVR